MTVFTVFTLNKLTLLSTVIKFFQIQEFLKGPVQTPWTEFWATLTPLPLCRQFYLIIAVIKCCSHLSNPPPPHLSTWFVHAPLVERKNKRQNVCCLGKNFIRQDQSRVSLPIRKLAQKSQWAF